MKKAKCKAPETSKARNSDLKIPTKPSKKKYGALVMAFIGNYKGKGENRVILHEVTLEKNGLVSYGAGRCWNFPVR